MIERTLTVGVSCAHAFRVWTKKLDLWWPPNHRLSGESDSDMVLEAHVGGRFYERTRSGREIEYGRITACEPPSRLAYDFYIGSDNQSPSAVEILFTPVPEGTRVEIHHGPGAMEAPRWSRTVGGYKRAWGHLTEVLQTELEQQ